MLVRWRSSSSPAQTTANRGGSKRAEKDAIKKVLNNPRFGLPAHDRSARVDRGMAIARSHDSVPGPIVQSVPKRNWLLM